MFVEEIDDGRYGVWYTKKVYDIFFESEDTASGRWQSEMNKGANDPYVRRAQGTIALKKLPPQLPREHGRTDRENLPPVSISRPNTDPCTQYIREEQLCGVECDYIDGFRDPARANACTDKAQRCRENAQNKFEACLERSGMAAEEDKSRPIRPISPMASTSSTSSSLLSSVSPLTSQEPMYKVIGVSHDDVLNIRKQPGGRSPIVGNIPADGINIQVVGAGTLMGNDFWLPVRYSNITGWVNSKYLAQQ